MTSNEIFELIIQKRSACIERMANARDAQFAAYDRLDFQEADRQGEEAKAAFAAYLALDDLLRGIQSRE